MKRIIVLISILLLILNCDKKTTVEGMVGQKLHLAPTVTSPADTAGCFFRWEFEKKPAGSQLDVLDFQPNNRNYNIYFVPDVPGEYQVQCMIIERDGIVKRTQKFYCPVIEDTMGFEPEGIETADTAGISPEYGEIEEDTVDTTEMVEEDMEEDTTTKEEEKKEREYTIQPLKSPVKGNGYQFTIQLISRKSYNKAKKDMANLEKHNLDVYLQKKELEKTGETWYRVRTGTFDKFSMARENAEQLAEKLSKYGYRNFWIDYLRK